MDSFFNYLSERYPLPSDVTVLFEKQDVEFWQYPDGNIFYAQINDMGDGFVYIFVAERAPVDPLLLMAHEYCHILQMYVWNTFPDHFGYHPPPDDPLEIQAHEFAGEELQRYRCIPSIKP